METHRKTYKANTQHCCHHEEVSKTMSSIRVRIVRNLSITNRHICPDRKAPYCYCDFHQGVFCEFILYVSYHFPKCKEWEHINCCFQSKWQIGEFNYFAKNECHWGRKQKHRNIPFQIIFASENPKSHQQQYEYHWDIPQWHIPSHQTCSAISIEHTDYALQRGYVVPPPTVFSILLPSIA